MATELYYLVVRADKTARILRRLSWALRDDETAFRIRVEFPPGWAAISPEVIQLRMPEPPTAVGDD